MFRFLIRLILILSLAWATLVLTYRVEPVHPPSTLMLADWLSGRKPARTWVPLEQMSTPVIESVIAAEDSRFCEHGGVEWETLQEVTEEALEGNKTRGASTIAMQSAKNLFLWHGRSYLRKALEVPMALGLDVLLGKRRLLEIYLNIAELGDGIYGFEAAAKHYYGKSAAHLTAFQAAQLAAILPNPSRNPHQLSPAIASYAATIRTRAQRTDLNTDCIFR